MIQNDARAVTLFCFPCAGGSASAYMHWRQALPSWIRIRPVEPPGRGARMKEPLLHDFDRLVGELTQDLLQEELNHCVFFGHSLGALLAYGCAHALRDLGRTPPAALVAACSAAPSRRNDARLATLKGDAALIAEMRRLNGTPEEVYACGDLLRMTLDVLAADFAICASFKYRPRPSLPTRLIVVGGREDSIEEAALAAWGDESRHDATVAMFDGGHFFFKNQESAFLDFIARQLRDVRELLC